LFIVSEWEPRLSTVEAKNFLFIFRCISKFCSSNDLEISILPRYANKDLEFRFEKEFYDSIPNFKFNIAFKDSDLSNYSTADNGFGVVFFFSTLGYEIGARNQVPVVSISFRAKVEKNSYRTFGWPADLKLPIKGVCDEISEESILGTLETLHSGGIGIEIFKRLCVMDQGNDIFRKFLARYLD
jgi:surface carbohydrate biosynthesis protein